MLIKALIKNGIKHMIFTPSVRHSFFVENARKELSCYEYDDPRSVAYIGTGMAAESNETVVICTNGDIEYRSFCPGLTEAFYRNLPIIAVTISDHIKLDYDVEIKDTVKFHKRISGLTSEHEMDDCIYNMISGKKPCHVDIDLTQSEEYVKRDVTPMDNDNFQSLYDIDWLIEFIPESCAVFVGNGFNFQHEHIGNTFSTSAAGGYEGVLNRTLGASLCGKKAHYIGLATEKEFIHDINCLGNRCINNKVVFIVYAKDKKSVIENYASALSFTCMSIKKGDKLPELPDSPTVLIIDSE